MQNKTLHIVQKDIKIMNILKRFYSNLAISTLLTKRKFSENETVTIQGWIKSLRKMKEHIFIDVSDGSSKNKMQVVLKNEEKHRDLKVGCSVAVKGTLNVGPSGRTEVNATDYKILGNCSLEEGYPFAPRKSYSPEYVRQYLHLRSRTEKFGSLLRIRHGTTKAINNYLDDLGYINIHTPILTSNDCEGAGEVFNVQPEREDILKKMQQPDVPLKEVYFNNKVFLTVSGQLHLEAVAHGLSKVYTLGPTFRAENSRSRLHLSEFYMLEVETAFNDNLQDLLSFVENLTKNVTLKVLDSNADDVQQSMAGDLDFTWTQKKFPVITYKEAVDILRRKISSGSPGSNFKDGFSKEDEFALVKHCGNVPVFVINWPKVDKPFYMKEHEQDSNLVEAFDLLAPNVGEIAGGSLREHNHDKLKSRLSSDKLDWYLQLRQFGGVPTGGFGLGLERYLLFLLGTASIKDTIPFPRWPHNCTM